MNELLIAIALWCGQVGAPNNFYSVTRKEIDQCRSSIFLCVDKTNKGMDEAFTCIRNTKVSQ